MYKTLLSLSVIALFTGVGSVYAIEEGDCILRDVPRPNVDFQRCLFENTDGTYSVIFDDSNLETSDRGYVEGMSGKQGNTLWLNDLYLTSAPDGSPSPIHNIVLPVGFPVVDYGVFQCVNLVLYHDYARSFWNNPEKSSHMICTP